MKNKYEGIRFYPVKRMAIDGKIWWVVWDKETHDYSKYICHERYKRKKDAQYIIDKFGQSLK